jgi:16S rRNA (guanine527-N7)-methyltransferase
MTNEQFMEELIERGIRLTETQQEQFEQYYRQLVEWNEKINLTAITERGQVYLKHFFDSISLSFYVDMNQVETMADIGAGAGFPGIPLKIIYPHIKLTIVDSLNKRIQFLQHTTQLLGLRHVNCVHGRAEEMGRDRQFRDQFDLVTARAVARLNVLSEFCLPFARPNGRFVAMKGMDADEETSEARYAIRELKGEWEGSYSFTLPFELSSRQIIVVRKTSLTPAKYPRKPGTPTKSPLLSPN